MGWAVLTAKQGYVPACACSSPRPDLHAMLSASGDGQPSEHLLPGPCGLGAECVTGCWKLEIIGCSSCLKGIGDTVAAGKTHLQNDSKTIKRTTLLVKQTT